MFDFAEDQLAIDECDDTRRFTEAWLDERQGDVDAVFARLDETSGFCD